MFEIDNGYGRVIEVYPPLFGKQEIYIVLSRKNSDDKINAVLSPDLACRLRDYLNSLDLSDATKPAAPLFWLGRDAEAV